MAEGEDVLSLMLFTVLVYPVCKWIMGSKRFGKRSVWYAMALLAAVAAVHIAWEWRERGPNHYQLLGVGREATPLEIKKAYKRASLELHPDKNPSPEAVDQFAEMKDAYEVLMDQEFRDIYNKLGPEAIRTKQRMDETELLLAIGAQYVVWGVIAYLLTMGAAGAAARAAVFTGEIAMIVLEITNISTGQGSSLLPPWFAPSVTDHEVIWLVRAAFPAYLTGARALCAHRHVDVGAQTRDLLAALQKGHAELLLKLQLLQTEIRDLSAAAAARGGSGNPRLAAGADKAVTVSAKQSPAAMVRELEQRMKEHSQNIELLATPIQEPVKGRSNFWWILGAYVVFYYFTQ
eukprot:TRINITY_DN6644_c0_g1_i1.p1 TRINITY_DN6644_c0_g1~~TRINITY_DN6644_c0_g1_i1.p1  ORF type:complete len:347 (+),score=139.68 TRINITY_DN6644_c0_g1_i1:210-1250(+)